MPAPLDLTGRIFGCLTVLEQSGRVKFGRDQAAWRCRCTCGREEIFATDQLVKRGIQDCAECRQADCVVCGKRVPLERGKKNTCSDVCELVKVRAVQMEHYYRKVESDPQHNVQAHARRAARMAADPERSREAKEKERERMRRRAEALRADPQKLEADRIRRRELYAEVAEKVQARRREALRALDDAEFERRRERHRNYDRAYKQQWRDSIKADPESHRQYLDLSRAYRREWERRRALARLAAAGEALQEKMRNKP